MSIKMPVVIEYDGKGAKKAKDDLASLAKSYLKNSLSAGAAYEIAKKSILAANADAQSQKQLALALQNSAGANDYAVAQSEKFISALQYQVAVADDKLRPALQTLATVTHNVSQAQDLLKVALDVSAAKGIDLENVSTALSKAYQGNIGALRRMGIAVSDTAIKNKDFSQALLEVKMATQGAAAEAASGAEGGWRKLGLVVQDLTEAFGYSLNAATKDYVSVLDKAGQAVVKSNQQNGWLAKTINAVTSSLVDAAIGGVAPFARALGMMTSKSQEAGNALAALESRNRTALALQGETIRANQADAAATAKATKAKQDATKAATDLAQANKDRLASALQTAADKVQTVRDKLTGYAGSLRDAVSGYVSLSDAVSAAQQTEDDYQAALEERKAAYEELAKLQTVVFDAATGKTTTANAEDLAAAMERVAKAEGAVSAAQAQRKDYTAQFQDQVNAAKSFATDLQALAAAGLQAPGIQQLLNLGPVAGDQVAKDLLAGTKGITIGSLNQTLGEIAGMGYQVGNTAGLQMYGSDLTAAAATQTAVQTAQTIHITMTSADPDKVVEALKKYQAARGSVPIKVSG